MEELRFLRGDVADADADVAVIHLAVLNQALDRRTYDVRGNRKSHARKAAGFGNQECIDANNFSVGIDQRTAGVTRIDGCIGLYELPWRTPVSGVRIGTV